MNFDQLKKRGVTILGKHPLTDEEITYVEKTLKIKLPLDFVEINKGCSYEYGHLDFLNFGRNDNNSVIKSTLGLWSYFKCPHEFIMLYDDGTGVILMDVKGDSGIIYSSIEDTENIVFRKRLNYKHSSFPTFFDFYSYLLDEAEKKQKN